ncbi:NAD(P)H-hydrate dehydratase [Oricola sp.]|uniref:NAD(P)H-hydrate dehydratase n=1 Tax=Oricola sp. TaxID=1979950 RepID=UPI003BA9E6A4
MSCAQMSRADSWTIQNGFASGYQLMLEAGAAIAGRAMQEFAGAATIHVLCGPGNNGGDGYVAATKLAAVGVPIRIYALGAPRAGSDAAIARNDCPVNAEVFPEFSPEPRDLVIDAVFGAGLTRELPVDVVTAFTIAREARCRVIAVDLPSGLNGDSGFDLGGTLQADVTVTFFRKKPGHLLYPGRALCGEIFVADIGVRDGVFEGEPPSIFENQPVLWAGWLPDNADRQHKYTRGHVGVFSGPRLASGASRLAALSAQAVGPGAVTILGRPSALDIQAAHVTSIMLAVAEAGDGAAKLRALKGCSAAVIGPGFRDLREAASIIVSHLANNRERPIPLVVDADGITALARQPETFFEAAAGSAPSLALTPHEGEFARLFPDLAAAEGMAKHERALAAAKTANAIVVYKGPDTVIAAPDGRVAINANAPPALATAGSGDVLSGLIAGLAARRMPLWEAACAAVWLHGESGAAAGPLAIAEDLVPASRMALESLLSR